MKQDKLIDFGGILKKAWHYVWSYKFLWLLGLLAGGSLSSAPSDFSSVFDQNSGDKWQSMLPPRVSGQIPDAGQIFGVSDTAISAGLIFALVAAFLAILFIIIYLNVSARGAIITAINKLDRGIKVGLSESWKEGHKYFWRIFLYSIIVSLVFLLPFIFLATPIVIMAVIRWYIPAIIVGLVFFLIYLIFVLYIALTVQYGERILVIEDKGAWESFKLGVQFFNKNWKNVLLTQLIIIGLMIGVGTVLLISLLLVGGTAGILVYGAYLVHIVAAYVIGIPLGLILFIALLAASGLISAYQSTVYTLAYREINRA